MIPDPAVSVVISTYNHERFLDQAIASVLQQRTPFPIEIIISEDCSTDFTRRIVTKYALADPARIRPIFSHVNLNTNEVLLRAFRAARGRYIAVIDGDDYWTNPDKLRIQFEMLESDPTVSVCFHDAMAVDVAGTLITPNIVWSGWPNRLGMAEIVACDHIPTCSALARSSALQDLPSWYVDAPFGDWPLWLTAARHGSLLRIDRNMAAWRIHDSGVWSSLTEVQQAKGIIRMLELMRTTTPAEWLPDIAVASAAWARRLQVARGDMDSREAIEALQPIFAASETLDHLRRWYEEMIGWQLSMRSWAHIKSAESCAKQKQWPEAAVAMLRATEFSPNHAYAHHMAGYYFSMCGDLASAIREATKAGQLRPDWFDPFESLSYYLDKVGDRAAALHVVNHALSIREDIHLRDLKLRLEDNRFQGE